MMFIDRHIAFAYVFFYYIIISLGTYGNIGNI